MQGETYNEERQLGIIWSPQRGKGGLVPHSWKVFKALTERRLAEIRIAPKEVKSHFTFKPVPGCQFIEKLGGKEGTIWGNVYYVNVPEEIRLFGYLGMQGAVNGAYTYRLLEKEGGTLLQLSHTVSGVIQEQWEEEHSKGWEYLLGTLLKYYVETKNKTEAKMVDVLTEITINRPISQVSEYAANPDHAVEWYENIKSVEWKTPMPLTLGSQIAFKANFLGRELAYIYEIVEWIPGDKLVMKTANGPFPMKTIYTWQEIDENRTIMTLRNKGNPTGFNKIISLFMTSMMRRANMKDLKKIKAILEKSF